MRPDRARAGVQPARMEILDIDHVAAGGDGAGQRDGQPAFVPFTLPGERVRAAFGQGARGVLQAVDAASPERVAPPCPAFGRCGGCALQHWADAPYAAWKLAQVTRALARAGFADAVVQGPARTPAGARRRMEFAARRGADGVMLGLHEAGSSQIVPLTQCVVAHPVLEKLLATLPPVLNALSGLRRLADVAVNLTDAGPDLLIRADAEASAQDRTRLAAFAQAQGIARISWRVGAGGVETAAQAGAPALVFAGVSVAPPPGAFLQASREGEAAIVAAVLAGLPKLTGRSRIVELYAGIGTLSFPLAQQARVQAYEGDPAAAAALRRAATGTRVEAVLRDLARQPLQARELDGAACVVLDPPFAGAGPQMTTLAASGVKRVIMVSCNPLALGREAAMLRAAGFGLVSATAVDQFLWSAQIEAVAVFGR